MAPSTAGRAAIGFSPHTGWAAVVAVSGARDAPSVVGKRRVDMATTFETGAVYHQAQALPASEAEALVRSSEQRFVEAARAAIAALAAELRARQVEPVASVVLVGHGRPLPPLASILRSHALVHAAEGELYRRVLVRASEACGIPAARVATQGLPSRVAEVSGLAVDRLASVLAGLGKVSGRPWSRDQKDATLAAWLALAKARALEREGS